MAAKKTMKLRGYFARLKNESFEEREHIHTFVHTLTHKDFCTECINPNCTVVFYTLQNCTFSSMEAGERTKVPLNVNFAIFFFFLLLFSLSYFSA